MARPRQFIRVVHKNGHPTLVKKGKKSGKEIDGLSLHKPTGQFYRVDDATSKREYLGSDLRVALSLIAPKKRAITFFETPIGECVAIDAPTDEWSPELLEKMDAQAQLVSLAHGELDINKQSLERILSVLKPSRPSKEKLNDCFPVWSEWSKAAQQTKDDTERHFTLFVDTVGNVPISTLTHEHFAKLQKAISKHANSKTWSIKTQRDYHKSVAKVLKLAKRKNRTWPFPNDMLEWVNDWRLDLTTPYVPKPKNKTPIAVDDFHRCLDLMDSWASIDVTDVPTTTDEDCGKKTQLQNKQRDGVQWGFLLRLAINCSLGNTDCGDVEWSHIKTEAEIPHLDFARGKPEHQTGFEVPRKVPLLPTTLEYFGRWQKYRNASPLLFLTAQGTPYDKDSIGDTFKRIVKEAQTKEDWTFKHIRNVAASLAKAANLSIDERQAILGHVAKGTNTFYEGEPVDEKFLQRTVDLVGEKYFAK